MHKNPSSFIWIAAFALASALVNGLGILSIMQYKNWAEKALPYFMCFAAGILISTPLLLALPRALQFNSAAGFTALGGFLFLFLSNKLIKHYTKKRRRVGPLAFLYQDSLNIGIAKRSKGGMRFACPPSISDS